MKPQEAHDVTMWHVFELVKWLNMDSYFLLQWWFWPEKNRKRGFEQRQRWSIQQKSWFKLVWERDRNNVTNLWFQTVLVSLPGMTFKIKGPFWWWQKKQTAWTVYENLWCETFPKKRVWRPPGYMMHAYWAYWWCNQPLVMSTPHWQTVWRLAAATP